MKTSKPYYKEILESDWIAAGDEYVTKIAKSEHNRGKFPHVRCLVPGESGGYSECFTDGEVDGEGNIVIQIGRPGSIRVEVRK